MSYLNSSWSIRLPLIIAVSLILGVFVGMKISSETSVGRFTVYPQTNKLSALIDFIEEQYVDSVSRDSLIEKAIPEILDGLDPHSVYIPASEFLVSNEALEGNFDGIGIQFNIQQDTVIVIHTIPGGPSEKLGLRSGDRLVRVDDTLIAGVGITNDGVFKKLKGPKGTRVKISVKRKQEKSLIHFDIPRGRIPLKSLDVAYMVTESCGYLKLSNFSKDSYDEFLAGVGQLHAEGATELILDLRGNTGGFMDVAIRIADEFLPKGKMIVYTEGRARPRKVSYASDGGVCLNDKLIVLLDEGSASASEIVAGAIQDNDRGTIVGRRSFGKGLVQEQIEFPDGSALRLTIARYYTPTGRCIQKPYLNGTEKYYEELMERMVHGEMEVADSIRFPDSLRYVTPGGKVVYGGGGIMPDVFVPFDTLGVTPLYSRMANSGALYGFAFEYADRNRERLARYSSPRELEKYLSGPVLIDPLIRYAREKGIRVTPAELKTTGNLVVNHAKALIARNILDDKGFYPILHRTDQTLKKALEVLND